MTVIRPATVGDQAAIDTFDPFAGDRPADVAAGTCLVAVAAGTVAGYVVFHPSGFNGRPFVDFLAVHPDHRRRGIGVALLRAAEAALGAGRVFISTEEHNHVMQSLLAGDGWTFAGRVDGANEGGAAELYYFRDPPG